MRLAIGAFLLSLLVGAVGADGDRNRIDPEFIPSYAIAVAVSASARRGDTPDETWHATLTPRISGQISLFAHLNLWLILPAVVEVGFGKPEGVAWLGGVGDIRLGVGYMGSLDPFRYNLGVGLSIPSGVGEKYAVRLAGYSSGSGEYLFVFTGGLAYLRDPVAVRLQMEGVLGSNSGKWTDIGLREVQTAVSALLVLNRQFSLELGTGLLLDSDTPYSQRPGLSEPVLSGHVGLTGMFDGINASFSVSKNFVNGIESVALNTSLGISWGRI